MNVALSGARLVRKRGWFWAALHWIVWGITLGKQGRFRDYVTTIGPWIAVPVAWPEPEGWTVWHRSTIVHELWHVRTFRAVGFGSAVLGILPLGLAYLFIPLPIGLAWCRYALEREAFARGYEVLIAERASTAGWLIERAVDELCGPSYGWAWPFRAGVRRWFQRRLRDVR